MGCRECKQSELTRQAGEVTAVVTDYLSYLRILSSDSHSHEVTIGDEILRSTETEDTIVKTQRNDIQHIGKGEITKKAMRISISARTRKSINNLNKKEGVSVIAMDSGALIKSFQRHLVEDE